MIVIDGEVWGVNGFERKRLSPRMSFGDVLQWVQLRRGSVVKALVEIRAALADGRIRAWKVTNGRRGKLIQKHKPGQEIEFYRPEIERTWPMVREASPPALSECHMVIPKPRGRRGPKRGTIDKHGAEHRALHPEMVRIITEKGCSATAAARELVYADKVPGRDDPKSKITRLAKSYRKLPETPSY